VTRRRVGQIGIGIGVLALVAWGATRGVEQLIAPPPEPAPAAPATPTTPHITATLYYGSRDGQALVAVRREVPLAETVVAQGRAILTEQFANVPAPYVSVIPKGTQLRALYVTERGDAFVDVSGEISAAHPGGSFTELLTVYAIVNAVTANLPAIQRVQLLVDGKEVDTIAGHVDIRRPLMRDASLVRDE
jgi:spore germination protein GerM